MYIRYASGTLLDFVLNVDGLGSKGHVERITDHIACDCACLHMYLLYRREHIITLFQSSSPSRTKTASVQV